MSAITLFLSKSLILHKSNKLGDVDGSNEYPVISAPIELSHKHNQEPLNPVCPVKNTFLPFQNV
ncbi:hypothetical protein D3C80_2149820 [compost metagenome]